MALLSPFIITIIISSLNKFIGSTHAFLPLQQNICLIHKQHRERQNTTRRYVKLSSSFYTMIMTNGKKIERDSSFFSNSKQSSIVSSKSRFYSSDTNFLNSKNKSEVEKRRNDNINDWKRDLELIRRMRIDKSAEVDKYGCGEIGLRGAMSEKQKRFQVLISAMLSSQTRDLANYEAMNRLKEACKDKGGISIDNLLELGEKKIALLFKPISFYNRKASNIIKTCYILKDNHLSDIPKTAEEIEKLPGIGPKMMILILYHTWNISHGVCVDTHVHRISNRLGWVKTWNHDSKKSKTSSNQNPEKTRKELEKILPKSLWNEINPLLVGFGQQTCKAIGPLCSICLLHDICPSSRTKVVENINNDSNDNRDHLI